MFFSHASCDAQLAQERIEREIAHGRLRRRQRRPSLPHPSVERSATGSSGSVRVSPRSPHSSRPGPVRGAGADSPTWRSLP